MKAAAAAVVTAALLSAQPVTRDAYVMGTRARLATYATGRAAGLQTLESALQALEQTERELSTWREDSAMSRLNRQPIGAPWIAEPSLCSMLTDVFHWSRETGGAFDPGIGRLLAAWDVHGSGAVPSDRALEEARAASGLRHFTFDRERCMVTRTADATLDVGAFGKGEALDRVERQLGESAWMVDLGGQVSVGGAPPPEGFWRVDVAHPLRRQEAYLHLRLTAGSLSTSAGAERDLRVGGVRVGHILDPRTGAPARFAGSVTVWHRRGLVADILSTALYAMGPEEGMAWAEARGLAVGYLIPENGRLRLAATPTFTALIALE